MDLDILSSKFVQQRYNDTAFVIFQQEQRRFKQDLKRSPLDSINAGLASQSVLKESSGASLTHKQKLVRSSVCTVL